MFRLISAGPPRRALGFSAAMGIPSNLKQKAEPGTAAKKSQPAAEPGNPAGVDVVAPGEAPQPLTLNHPASNLGRVKRSGFSFSATADPG